jgi:actin cytoskeleton-regulatory complex protein PAN1
MLTGAEALPFLTLSGLPRDTLAHIWSLADVTQTGQLTLDTFAVCLQLVYLARQGTQLPPTLPPAWVPPALRGRTGAVPGTAPRTPSYPSTHTQRNKQTSREA